MTEKPGSKKLPVVVVAALSVLVAGLAVLQCSEASDEVAATPPAPRATASTSAPRPFLPQQPPPPGEATAPAPGDTVDEAACTACEKQHIVAGDCEPDSGCDGLSSPDKPLCEALVACARRTNCWVNHPLDCLCGSAPGVDCAQGAANGACRAEIQAATKTTDPVKNGTLFFDPTLPAGRANRLIACAFDHCKTSCAPKSALP